jgi:predicted amidohydrolase
VLFAYSDWDSSGKVEMWCMRSKDKPRVALAQPKPQNQMAQLVEYVRRAHSSDVKLILFPEGYLPSYTDENALSIEDEAIRSIKKLSSEYGLAIATGIKEKRGKSLFLSLFLFSEGDIAAIHRKVFLAEFEKPVFNARKFGFDSDDVFPVVDISGIGKVGCLLCYENLFPETHRLLRYKGAEIVLGPSGFGMRSKLFDYRESWLCELRSRSMENKMYVVSATNAIGEGLMGVVIDPVGRVLVNEDSEGYKSCSVDLTYLRDLRAGLGNEVAPCELKINIGRISPSLHRLLHSESIAFRKRSPNDE